MPVVAKLRNLRIAPRKVRLVSDLIRGKSIENAQSILSFTTQKSAPVLLKLLKQAIANARNNLKLDETNLYISKITVDEGPKLKRWMPRARGVTYPIQKKTSHVLIVLDEIKKGAKKIKGKKPSFAKATEGKEEKIQPETVEIKEEKAIKKEKPQKESKIPTGQAKFKPELEVRKIQKEKGIRKIFRRKSF